MQPAAARRAALPIAGAFVVEYKYGDDVAALSSR
jgi:hypothetical protein